MKNSELFAAMQSGRWISFRGQSAVRIVGITPERIDDFENINQWTILARDKNGKEYQASVNCQPDEQKGSAQLKSYNVLCTAHGESWQIRTVEILESPHQFVEDILRSIYSNGQSAHPLQSVSVGDIILRGGERWLVCPQGRFHSMTSTEYHDYCRTARASRPFSFRF